MHAYPRKQEQMTFFDQLVIYPSQLPSNTVLITLSPPGKTFCLSQNFTSSSRASTPSIGYASDPESEVRRVKQSGEHPTSSASEEIQEILPLSRRRHRRGIGSLTESRDNLKTAGWPDILKCVDFYGNQFLTQLVLSKTCNNPVLHFR